MSNFFTHKFRTKSPLKIAAMIIFGTIFIGALAALFGFIIMWLWNWLMPDIFGLTTITYWQGIGVFALAKILFGSGGFGNDKKSSKKSKRDYNRNHKNDFSKWKYYDEFWKEEGSQAYNEYIARKGIEVSEEGESEEEERDNSCY